MLSNKDLLGQLDRDPVSLNKDLLKYVTRRFEELGLCVTEIKAKLTKSGRIITLSLHGLRRGMAIDIHNEWTDMEILVYNIPVAVLIDSVIQRVSEVPLDGIPAS